MVLFGIVGQAIPAALILGVLISMLYRKINMRIRKWIEEVIMEILEQSERNFEPF